MKDPTKRSKAIIVRGRRFQCRRKKGYGCDAAADLASVSLLSSSKISICRDIIRHVIFSLGSWASDEALPGWFLVVGHVGWWICTATIMKGGDLWCSLWLVGEKKWKIQLRDLFRVTVQGKRNFSWPPTSRQQLTMNEQNLDHNSSTKRALRHET